jgi:hypothetical protein
VAPPPHSRGPATLPFLYLVEKRRAKKIEVLDLGASPINTKTIYHSVREAARALNIDRKTISNYFRNNQKKTIQRSLYF